MAEAFHYVTMRRGSGRNMRVARLLGPQKVPVTSDQVDACCRLACEVDGFHWFDSFGGTSYRADQGPGAFNGQVALVNDAVTIPAEGD